jgi:D-3-phosphoglycerate dehydrogenase
MTEHRVAPRALFLEGVSQDAAETLKRAGYDVQFRNGELTVCVCAERRPAVLTVLLQADELKQAIADVTVLGIRSKTQVSKVVLQAAKQLKAIGCFASGTNNVDCEAAKELRIPVFNVRARLPL